MNKPAPIKKNLHIKRKSPTFSSSKIIYSFESFDAFCDFCTFIERSPYKSELPKFAKASDLYEYNSNYYLIFTKLDQNSEVMRFICHSITEFAHYIDHSELFEKKITEYGKLIMKNNAIEEAIHYFV